jgi:soluble lytic murein transglycosylase-like protein
MHFCSRSYVNGLFAAAAIGAALSVVPARADIYGYVDEKGVAHLSNVPRDHRYYLFKKEPEKTTFPGSSLVIINARPTAPRRTTNVNPSHRKQYAPLVSTVAKEHGLEPALLHAIIMVESGYNPKARSIKGASGLMQLMPETARRYHVADIWDPQQNLAGGARYLRYLLALFNNNLGLALAAYNAGENAVIQHGNRIPPYPETRNYVPRVMQHYHLYANVH